LSYYQRVVCGYLDIELTERCNNNCIHCYINLPLDDSVALKKEITTTEVKRILKEAVSLGCLTVRFTGGEPLLREDFEELYIFARKSGLRVIIFTNATLITPRLVELFRRIPPLERIEVSVYGMRKESYESVTRISGSFAAAWRGINLLLEKKIPFIVKSAILPTNKDELKDFEKWAANLPWMDRLPSYSMYFDLRARRDNENKNKLIKSLRLKPQECIDILIRRKQNYIRGMKQFCSKFMRPPGSKLFSCGSGVGGGCVDAYGNFQPCMLLRHPSCVYDLKKGTLKDALVNFFTEMRKIEASNPKYLSRCARCFLKGLCEQCPGKSWEEHGTLDTPVEYFCEVAHAQARFLGLMQDGEKAWGIQDWQDRVKEFTRKECL